MLLSDRSSAYSVPFGLPFAFHDNDTSEEVMALAIKLVGVLGGLVPLPVSTGMLRAWFVVPTLRSMDEIWPSRSTDLIPK